MKKIRIAVVGCGRVSERHFESIKHHHNDLQLVAICDTDQKVLDIAKSKHKVKAFLSLKELLDSNEIDIVALCTPSGLHAEQTVMCSQHSVDVITEKPMATRWKDGLRMVKSCDENNTNLFVVKQNRFNSTLRLLKRAITENRFGKIHLVQVNVFWTRPQSYYDQARWRGTWEFDGGAFMNQASHYVDLLDWLVGPIEKIQAMTSTTRNIEVEDSGVLNIKWRNGALGSMSVTMLTYPSNLEGSITILGETGSVKIDGIAVNEISLWKFDEPKDYDKDIHNANYKIDSVYGFGHLKYYNNVIKSLRNEVEPETDGREGLKSLEVLIATYLSARDNKTVSLPIEY